MTVLKSTHHAGKRLVYTNIQEGKDEQYKNLVTKKGTIENLAKEMFWREFEIKNDIGSLWIDPQLMIRTLNLNSTVISQLLENSKDGKWQLEELIIKLFESSIDRIFKEMLLEVQDSEILLKDYLQLVSNHFDNIDYFRRVDEKVNQLGDDKQSLDIWLEENEG